MVNNKVESETNTQKIKDFLDLYEKKDMSKIDQKIFKGIIERKVSEEDAFSGSDDNPSKKSIIHKNEIIQDINVFNNDEQIQPMSFEPENESKDELTSRINVDNHVPNEYDDFKLPEIANKYKKESVIKKIVEEEKENRDLNEYSTNTFIDSKKLNEYTFKDYKL